MTKQARVGIQEGILRNAAVKRRQIFRLPSLLALFVARLHGNAFVGSCRIDRAGAFLIEKHTRATAGKENAAGLILKQAESFLDRLARVIGIRGNNPRLP